MCGGVSRPAASVAYAWVAPLTFAVHALGAHADRVGMWADDALYASMADALRRGGPLVADVLPGAPGVAKYPVAWPATVAALQALGASLQAILLVNAALWALTAQLVVSALLPRLGASGRARVAVGLVLALHSTTMDLVPQLMSEPLFALSLTAGVVLLLRGATRPAELAALAVCAVLAANTRSVGVLYAGAAGVGALISGRRREAGALLLAAAVAVALSRLERTWAPPPTADALAALRYYVAYDVHPGWYRDRLAEGGVAGLLDGLATVVGANLRFGVESLGGFFAPDFGPSAPGAGTRTLGGMALALCAFAAWREARVRPLVLLLAVHIGVFLAWTWPFSARFWLPLVPIMVATVAVAIERFGRVGELALLPLAGTFVLLHASSPITAAELLFPSKTAAAPSGAEAELDVGLAALRAHVHPGDVLAGESYVFWLARPLGASAVELRTLVPFADLLAQVLHTPRSAADLERESVDFGASLRRLSRMAPSGSTVWVVCDPTRREPKLAWIAAAARRGQLADLGQFGSMRMLTVTPDAVPN